MFYFWISFGLSFKLTTIYIPLHGYNVIFIEIKQIEIMISLYLWHDNEVI